MTRRREARILAAVGLCWALAAVGAPRDRAQAILRDTGLRGGLVVHLGCGDGQLTAALRASEHYTVHGLAATPADVAVARAFLRAKGLYGPVAVEQLTGTTLPYADGLVNLVVVEAPLGVAMAEVLRVLAPGGVACVKQAGGWKTTVKPPAPGTDEWSHYLHDAGNNAVAADRVVGPPRRLQWVAPPLWLRSHETPSGIQAQVAAGGRLFYIFDEGLVGITDERLPDRWAILCRDAFNGKLLWRRALPEWGWRQWARARFEGKDWTKLRAARVSAPEEAQRRLVADGERLYATLGFRAPLSILDAATGELLSTVKGTEPTHEILLRDGIVVAHVRETSSGAEQRRGKKPTNLSTLVGVEAGTGKVLWRRQTGRVIRSVMLAVDGGKVVGVAGRELVCFALRTGKPLWQAALKMRRPRTLVAASGVVLLLGNAELETYDMADGKRLWARQVPRRSGAESVDLFVVDGLAWPGMSPVDEKKSFVRKSDRALAVGYDIRTGEEKKRIVAANFRSPEHHHRCYRNKATSRYIISGMEGAEFLDLRGDAHSQNNWLRGACRHGVMPCYGMLYVPADQCFCQPGGKLLGYAALAAAGDEGRGTRDEERLERGPAFGQIGNRQSAIGNPHDWPTYRHDAARHGSTKAKVGAKVAQAWRVKLGGRLTPPVVANGRLLVASIDTHTVHALDAGSGKEQWRYTAGGRIDSPPTVYRGLVLFGSADGRVTCLRASDGARVWRFLAAPWDRRIAYFDQLESAWPVHGSVLVRGGIAYVAAGRSTYLDGGIRFYGLEPATGKVLHQGRIQGPHRRIDGERDLAFWVPGANSDVLVSEGDAIYMRQKKLTPQLKEVHPKVLSVKGEADVGLHVFSTAGLLDGSWYNRTFWMYSRRWPGFQLAYQAPKCGQLLAVDEAATYAVKVFYRRNVHSGFFFPGREGYLLFADNNTNEPQIVGEEGARTPLRWLPQSDYSWGHGNKMVKLDSKAFGLDKLIGYTRAEPPLWTLWLPVRVRAMVKTRDVLFVAGPPDVLERDQPYAAFEGRRGARLVAVAAARGEKLGQLELDAPPVFDGMIATDRRLYLSLTDGSIACMAAP